MKVYRRIRHLMHELGSGTIAKRREAGQKLVQLLSDVQERSRLMQEAGSDGAVERQRALAEMWRYIILGAVDSVQEIALGTKVKARVTANDILLPFKLLKSCDAPYETKETMLYEPVKLSRKETKLVFTLCYDLLQDPTALQLAEKDLLKNLAYLCGRREYVAYMRPHQEMNAVVQEVEKRLVDQRGNDDILLYAGHVWENLLVTATKDLGMSMHLLMPGCVKIVAAWCQLPESSGPRGEVPLILRGLAALLQSDLEQAVAPMTRHGRPILSFVGKGYTKAPSELDREARHEYILAHL